MAINQLSKELLVLYMQIFVSIIFLIVGIK